MNLECDKAKAIRVFLESVGYRKWRDELTGGINAEMEDIDWALGVRNFEALAEAIDYE